MAKVRMCIAIALWFRKDQVYMALKGFQKIVFSNRLCAEEICSKKGLLKLEINLFSQITFPKGFVWHLLASSLFCSVF